MYGDLGGLSPRSFMCVTSSLMMVEGTVSIYYITVYLLYCGRLYDVAAET